ncbi:zinc uptake protein ZrgA [Vibrio sinaloensis]|uniref:zinc uptake protein ZrgA n=1 Tax=Photobacterium sp. (strain ATCC 43367) TaxID=379097 RepID=UPI00207027B0|nr:DUF2796 domain-containing protein [Vibrio sinaloensis]UPQ88265.1 DUF2796 domain-containing protein [Vibrio sinaloensis]
MKKLTPIAFALAFTSSTLVNADEGFRQHDAHVHGQVEINIAQDGNELLFEITAPGADVVGFEHAPQNAEQQQTLDNALAKLQQAANVFTLATAAGCDVEYQSVSHTLGESEEHHDHDKHEHHDHDKHEHHDHDKHEHHDHDKHEHHDHDKHEHHDHEKHEDHDHGAHSGHGEFSVQYHYQCQNIQAISSIDTQWFTLFPTTESIKVNILTDTKQAALELKSGQKTISF